MLSSSSGRPSGRGASVLVVAIALCLVMLIGLGALDYVARADLRTTTNLIREIRAQSLAQSIATQIESITSSDRWDNRFWPGDDTTPLTFTKGDNFEIGYVNIDGDAMVEANYDYVVTIYDLPFPDVQSYRIYVRIIIEGVTFDYVWDKCYRPFLLGSINRESLSMMKRLEKLAPGQPATDKALGALKAAAVKPYGTVPDELRADYDQLVDDLTRSRNLGFDYKRATGKLDWPPLAPAETGAGATPTTTGADASSTTTGTSVGPSGTTTSPTESEEGL